MREEIIGNARLILGDCREVLPAVGRVDAVVTDPPYAVPTTIAQKRTITRSVGDLSIIEYAMQAYLGAAVDMLMPNGRVFVFCDGTSYPVFFRVLYGRVQTALLIWNKGRFGMGREFRKQHELVMHGWLPETPIFGDGVGRSDILEYAPVPTEQRTHPAEKPVALISDLLRPCGHIVLDPFMGSGTTGVACAKLGRSFIGIEIEPKFFDIACRRIEAAQRQADMFVQPVAAPKLVTTDMFA